MISASPTGPFLAWLVRGSVHRPRTVLACWLGASLLAAAGMTHLEFDPSTASILVQEGADWQFYQQSLADYGGDEVLVVALESERPFDPALLGEIARLSERFADLPGVRRVDSLATVPVIRLGDDDALRLDPVLPEVVRPGDPALARVPQQLAGDRLAPGSLVSADGRVLAINLLLEPVIGHEIESTIDQVRREVAGRAAWVSGVPVFRIESNRSNEREILLFVPLTVAAIAALLATAFGSLRVVWISLGASGLGTLCALGAMGVTRTPLSFSTIVLPPLLLALGSAYTVHVLDAARGVVSAEELEQSLLRVARPIALSGLTTAIGFLGIALVRIDAIRDLGLFGAVGAMAVVSAALSAAPAALRLAPLAPRAGRPLSWVGSDLAPALFGFIQRRRKALVGIWLALAALALLGLPRMSVETDATRWFARGNEVRESYEAIRARLSGISPMNVVLTPRNGVSMTEPRMVAAIDGLSHFLSERPDVGKVLSMADPLRQIHAAFAGTDAVGLPSTKAQIEQYLVLLSSVDRLDDVLRSDRAGANVLLRVDDNSSDNLLDIARAAESWWREHGDADASARTTGIMYEFAAAEDEIAWGQLRGLSASLMVIAGLAAVIFRSLRVALLAMIPNVSPLLLTFGAMGFAGIPIDAATVVVGCLALGIAVDDTIHLLTTFVAHPQHRSDPPAALRDTLQGMLPAVLLTTIAVAIGFGVVGLSEFAVTRNFGLLTAATVVVALLADVTLLPALLLVTGGRAVGAPVGVSSCAHSSPSRSPLPSPPDSR
jgi:uncharacterized protein